MNKQVNCKIDYDIIYLPPDNYEYGNKYMTDFTLKLEHGKLTLKEYNEDKHTTRFVIETPNNKEHSEMEFTISSEIRNVNVGEKVSFLYNINNNEFKAFVFNKEELDKKNRSHSQKQEKVKESSISHDDDNSIIEMTNEWKKHIPFLNEKRWFDVRFASHVCSEEQLGQVYKVINESPISSTLKIGFQEYLSKLKHVRYKNIMNIEDEYRTFIKKQAERAMGKK